MRRRSGQLARAGVVLSVLLAPTARAAEAPAWLSWRAADGEASSAACFDETAFEANLSRRLG